MNKNLKVSIIGLGYVGLPLAIEFGKYYKTIGFDISKIKIKELSQFIDRENVISTKMFKSSKLLIFTSNINELDDTDIFIIAVPTPIDKNNKPDLRLLKNASKLVGSVLKKGSIIVYESTVFPGATEDFCVPILEKASRLNWKKDFFVGYSPERINPGDKLHQIQNIIKIVSGDTKKTLNILVKLYRKIIVAGICPVSSIRVAEAAKIIENTQRDINIALMNELAIIFDKLNLDTMEVIKAASTKWNFAPFKPGLVGGHCIGVDPYYLTYKSQQVGYKPKMILAGRKLNDDMPIFVAKKLFQLLDKFKFDSKEVKINILGITFKKNVKDLRNSKVFNLIYEIRKTNNNLFIYDPLINNNDLIGTGLSNKKWDDLPKSEVLILAVPHDKILKLGYKNLINKVKSKGIIVDIMSVIPTKFNFGNKINIWRL